MRKNIFLILGIMGFILIGSSFISGICCERVKDSNMWCQDVTDKNQCEISLGDETYRTWDYNFCNDVPECTGTCVNSIEGGSNLGICSENTPKVQCDESGGTWSQMEVEEINACKEICCFVGKDTYYISNARCTALSLEYGVEVKMREVASRDACLEQQTNIKEGACVISTPTERACVMSTNIDCTNANINKYADQLKVESPTTPNVRFYDGLLCTASMGGMGISDCTKSQDTECYENKVYYRDTCGNLANVYDSNKYNNADYWNYIMDAYDPEEVCTVTSGSNTCGNCEPTENTVCRDYREVSGATRPANNANGLMCGDLSCWYDSNGDNRRGTNEIYKHGESWCAESPGTLLINRNLTTGEIDPAILAKLENTSKYNIPGSRYYKLICSFGEVLVEECGDYRSSICMQGVNDYSGRKEASCVFNPWTICLNTMTRTQCEEKSGSLCKWVPGYRWDGETAEEEDRKELQGSCVPVFAPGFDFWKATGQGNLICGMGSVMVNTLFETPVTRDRDNMDSWSDGFLAKRCIDSCYAIPNYANDFNQRPNEEKLYPEDVPELEIMPGLSVWRPETEYQRLTIFYDESEYRLPDNVGSYNSLSQRRGHYCNKDGDPNHWLTGAVSGNNYDCTPGAGSEAKDERKERDYPIFLTNDEWINSITERARSIGDCGFKPNTLGEYTSPDKEMITAIFQKLKQDMSVKKNITVEQIIYEGGRYLDDEDLRNYEVQLAVEASEGYSCGDLMGTCATSEELCTTNGGTVNPEGTCWGESKCCVYPQEE